MYWSSQVAISHDNSLRVRIYGEEGAIQWFQELSEKITVIKQDGALPSPPYMIDFTTV